MNPPNPQAEREELAKIQHEKWSGWMRYIFSKCYAIMRDPDPADQEADTIPTGDLRIPKNLVERWKRQMNTPYEQLSEAEKDSDRKEADEILAAGYARREEWNEEAKNKILRIIFNRSDTLNDSVARLIVEDITSRFAPPKAAIDACIAAFSQAQGVSVEEIEKVVEQVLLNRIKLITQEDQTYTGFPAELIKELAQAIAGRMGGKA